MVSSDLRELQELVKTTIPPEKKAIMTSETLGNIVYVLAKHLTKIAGYSVASTILIREIRDIGRKDAEKLKKLLEIKEKNLIGARQLLRTAGILLGLELRPQGEHSIVVDCPFAHVKQLQPLICKICVEYNKGILEGFAGPLFKLVEIKKLTSGDGYCEFETVEAIKG